MDPPYRMHVKILRGNVTCRTVKRIVAGTVRTGLLCGRSAAPWSAMALNYVTHTELVPSAACLRGDPQ